MLENDENVKVTDIEDLKRWGITNATCPYYYSKEIMPMSDIVFMPYNYIIDAVVRKSLGIDLTDAIVIVDEAHNIVRIAYYCSHNLVH